MCSTSFRVRDYGEILFLPLKLEKFLKIGNFSKVCQHT